MRRPVLVDGSAHGSGSERNCAPASNIFLTIANRSKDERASLSIRVTVSTSPGTTVLSRLFSSSENRFPEEFRQPARRFPSRRPGAGLNRGTRSCQRTSVQLSENARAQVLNGLPSRSVGNGRPLA